MKKIILSTIALIVSIAMMANDGVYYTAGNQLVPLAETDIQVKKEILTISLLDNRRAKVDVYYEFVNPTSSSKTLQMGFEADPSYNDDYTFYPSGRHPHIFDFTVEMNGQKLDYQNAVCNLDGGKTFDRIDASKWKLDDEVNLQLVNKSNPNQTIDSYAYVYYFQATFRPGVNKVHHTYLYTLSMSVGTTFELNYKLSPATRWANHQIDDFTLVVRADNTAKHFLLQPKAFPASSLKVTEGKGKIRSTKSQYDTSYTEVTLRNGAITFHQTNYRPAEELSIASADELYAFSSPDGICHFGAFYDRSSSQFAYMWRTVEDHAPKDLNLVKRIARNLPYAHRGHVFKDATLKKYFESLWWYMPDPSYVDEQDSFTEADREMLNFDPSAE